MTTFLLDFDLFSVKNGELFLKISSQIRSLKNCHFRDFMPNKENLFGVPSFEVPNVHVCVFSKT